MYKMEDETFGEDVFSGYHLVSYNKAADNSSISNTETCPKNTLLLLSHMPGLV